MNFQILIIVQIAIDVFLTVCIFYLIFSISKKNRVVEEERIKAFLSALDNRINAANTLAAKMSSESEKGLNSSRNLLHVLEGKKVEIQGYLERIDDILKAIDRALPHGAEKDASMGKYKEAAVLAKSGYSVDEIAGKVGLPKGEVQLIIGLKKQ